MIVQNINLLKSLKNREPFKSLQHLSSSSSIIFKKAFGTKEKLFMNKFNTYSNNSNIKCISHINIDYNNLKKSKRYFSTSENIKVNNIINRNITFNKTNEENPALIKILKANDDKLNILMMKLNLEQEITDNLSYLKALAVCKYTESFELGDKSRKYLLDLFRHNDYSVLKKINFDENTKFIDYFSNLFNLNLEENDIRAIENKYFQIKDKLVIEQTIQLYDAIYYYEFFRFKLVNIKNEIINILLSNYLTMTNENNYNLNSSILFEEPKEIAKFSLFAVERLLLYTNPKTMHEYSSLAQILDCIQPLPKIISEIEHSSTIPDKIKQKVLIRCGEILNKFFKSLPKEDVDESLLIALSNSFFYGKLNFEIFDFFINGFYRNLANFELENIIELFFLILKTSKNDEFISPNKQKLMNQILIILENTNKEPMVYLNNYKFNIYLNSCKENLNKAFMNWLTKKDKNLNEYSEKDIDLYEKYLRVVNLSIDFYPFATMDLNYSELLLEELFITFKNVFKN